MIHGDFLSEWAARIAARLKTKMVEILRGDSEQNEALLRIERAFDYILIDEGQKLIRGRGGAAQKEGKMENETSEQRKTVGGVDFNLWGRLVEAGLVPHNCKRFVIDSGNPGEPVKIFWETCADRPQIKAVLNVVVESAIRGRTAPLTSSSDSLCSICGVEAGKLHSWNCPGFRPPAITGPSVAVKLFGRGFPSASCESSHHLVAIVTVHALPDVKPEDIPVPTIIEYKGHFYQQGGNDGDDFTLQEYFEVPGLKVGDSLYESGDSTR